MTKLSPDARDLIEAARAGAAPPPRARDRVRAGVIARVGAGVAVGSATVLGTSSTAAKTVLSAGLLFKCAAAVGVASVMAVVAVGSGLVPRPSWGAHERLADHPAGASQSPGPAAAILPAVTTATAAATAEPTETPVPAPAASPAPAVATAPSAARPQPQAASSHGPTPPASPPAASSLEAETALLARAQAEMRAGHPDRALAAFDEHDAAFKGGVLREEQRAGRILALCAAGRTGEAKAEAQRFLAASPRSPMAERVRSSCAGQASP